jgi:excisionase family DNA binding protein
VPRATPPRRSLATLPEAADYAACSVKTLRRRIADGTLTGYRFGPRALRVDLNELDDALRPIPTARGGAA